MALEYDALLLSRLQFAFTVAFHILFPAFTIGLAAYLAVLEGLWLRTRREAYKTLYLFWVKVFAISFGMGVVSGIVLSYQFGTNWAEFIRLSGGVIGPLLAYEVLTAFFLEASFLGVMLFGWKKVGPKLHFLATCLVAVGTSISAFWILSANSWMQTPAGYEVLADGRIVATSFMEAIFNPSFPSRLAHMLIAAFLTTALVVGGASAFQLLRNRGQEESRLALKMAIGLIAVLAPIQVLVGHESGLVAKDHQPQKLAAIEAYWETDANHPLILFAIPDRATQSNHFELAIPGGGVLVAPADEVVTGLDAFPPEDQPPVFIVFWSFRVMVGLGVLMLALGLWGAWLIWRKRLADSRLFLRFAVLMGPAGFVAVIAGWIVAEVGRQPWAIQGLLPVGVAVTNIAASNVQTTFFIFLTLFTALLLAEIRIMMKQIKIGPEA